MHAVVNKYANFVENSLAYRDSLQNDFVALIRQGTAGCKWMETCTARCVFPVVNHKRFHEPRVSLRSIPKDTVFVNKTLLNWWAIDL